MNKKTHALGWVIIILIISAFTVFAVKYTKVELNNDLTITLPSPAKIFNQQPADQKAILRLTTKDSQIKVGDLVKVDVELDTQDKSVDGVDVILNYNPVLLENNRLEPGQIFSNIMTNQVDQETGIIKFSALSKPEQTFKGTGILATLEFKALKAGTTFIDFDFQEDSTEETNVAGQGKDILKTVENLEINIE